MNPNTAPIAWIGLLYAVICLGTFAAHHAGEEALETPVQTMRLYQECCTKCLKLSNYTKTGPHILEAILVYMEGEFILSKTNAVASYVLIGIAVRIALRMGLHRDPTKVSGNISPFQAEMRRRIWNHLSQVDMLASFHIGLPSMVQGVESDTLPPRNLFDTDINESSTKLPEPRPDTEITSMSYPICKGRLFRAFGKITSQANRLSMPSYSEVMELDVELLEAYSRVPQHFKNQSLQASSRVLIQRFNITLLFHKSRCVLHRKFLALEKEDSRYAHSKNVALSAAMELLHCQSQIHEAVQPGGPMAHDKWYTSSLSMHDFLLAAMIIYMRITQIAQGDTIGYTELSSPILKQDMITALERSYTIWTEAKMASADAKKASDVLAIIVKKVRDSEDSANSGTHSQHDSLIGGLSIDGKSRTINQYHPF